jgi:uncharacterized membrane protein
MSTLDIAAAIVFGLCWLLYEPLLKGVAGSRGAIKLDMLSVREAWLRRMLKRENRIADSNLLGHQLSSASFFGSTNLLLIAAAAGLLFGGEETLAGVSNLAITARAPDWLIEIKIALVVVTLAKGFLDFVWAIRQLNFSLALFGAAPDSTETALHDAYARATGRVLNQAYAAFNGGMRTYYFALAAAAWLVSPWAMLVGAIAAFLLLLLRQTTSETALGIRDARRTIEAE